MDHVGVLPVDVVGPSDEFTLLGFIVAITNQSALGGTWDRTFYMGLHYRVARSQPCKPSLSVLTFDRVVSATVLAK